jgi:carbonic anhydrase
MHTVHFPDAKLQPEDPKSIAAAMGIMFSVDNSNVDLTEAEVKIIDNFFDSLYLNQYSDPTVLAEYGGLMNLIDMKNRWVYRGSLTTPPCSIGVFFNILSNVYPMKERHLRLFKKQLDRSP